MVFATLQLKSQFLKKTVKEIQGCCQISQISKRFSFSKNIYRFSKCTVLDYEFRHTKHHTHPNQSEIFVGPSALNFMPRTKKNLGSLSPSCKNRRHMPNHRLLVSPGKTRR